VWAGGARAIEGTAAAHEEGGEERSWRSWRRKREGGRGEEMRRRR